jgi:D-alanyl-D-alanine carboxypeptidase
MAGGRLVTNPQFEWAGGGLASTPEDLARWAKALYEGKVFRKKETLAEMLAGVDATGARGGGKGIRYGLGVQIRPSAWGPGYGHGGWFPGYRTEVEYFPEKRVAVAVQFNTDIGRQLGKGPRGAVADVAAELFTPGK